MSEAKHYRSPVVALARRLAGGSEKFVFNMYDKHMDAIKDADGMDPHSKTKHNIQREVAYAMKDEALRAALLGEFTPRISAKVEQIKKERHRIPDHEALILAYSYFALLARWVQHTAQDERITLENKEDEFLFAVQVASDRLRRYFPLKTE